MKRTEDSQPLAKDALHLLVLSAFVVAQPVFELLGRNPEFFVARGSRPIDVVLLVLVLTLLPLPLILVEAVLDRVSPRFREVVHRLLTTALLGMFFLLVLNRLSDLGGIFATLAAVLPAALVANFLLPSRGVQQIPAQILVLSFLLFPAFFVFRPAIFRFLWPKPVSVLPAAEVTAESPIFVIIFDEFPLASLLDASSAIDPILYPNFRALADEATWHRQATTVGDATLIAIPAILTGNYPRRGLQATVADHPANLFTLLQDDYEFRVIEERTNLCPPELCGERAGDSFARRMRALGADLTIVYLHLLLPAQWQGELPPIAMTWGDLSNSQRRRGQSKGLIELIDAVEPGRDPTLFFAHVTLPHGPYKFYPSGKTYSNAGDNPASASARLWGPWTDEDWVVTQSYQRHLLQVGYVDTLIGRLVERLRQTGLYEKSLIVITADHGCSFRTLDSRRAITQTNASDIMSVPLLIKAPFQKEGEISDRNVEAVDILPTMADLLGIELPWSVEGSSAGAAAAPKRAGKSLFSLDEKELLSFDPDALDQQRRAAVARKLALFGAEENRDLYGIGPLADELIGRRTADLSIRDSSGVRATLSRPERFRRVDPSSGVLPGEIAGFISRADAGPAPELAVAVNGVIRATTYTYRSAEIQAALAFSALVGEESFTEGFNEVAVFTMDREAGNLRLERTRALSESPYFDVNLAIAALPGVSAWGLHPVTQRDGETFRWTHEKATLAIPLKSRSRPATLKVDILQIGADDRLLKILVNGNPVLDHRFAGHRETPRRWSKTIPLRDVPYREKMIIELLSAEPGGGRFDQSFRGVALSGLYLIRSPEKEQDIVFADGFETGGMDAWSAVYPRP